MNRNHASERLKYFNDLGPRWDEVVGNDADRRARIAEVFGWLDIQRGDRVLDAGTGNGVLLPFIAEKTGREGAITAVDAAQTMVERARALYSANSTIEFVTGTLENIDLPSYHYNVILCFAVVPHLDNVLLAFRNLHRALDPKGVLYIFHLNDTRTLNEFHRGLDAPVKHDMLPDEAELRALLKDSGFTVVRYIDRPGLNFVECRP
jgi:demethylmenaquinone methyltransferase/2-methoxy-6-polyprenyl-1,4-benzoquinol methylase